MDKLWKTQKNYADGGLFFNCFLFSGKPEIKKKCLWRSENGRRPEDWTLLFSDAQTHRGIGGAAPEPAAAGPRAAARNKISSSSSFNKLLSAIYPFSLKTKLSYPQNPTSFFSKSNIHFFFRDVSKIYQRCVKDVLFFFLTALFF